MDYNKISLESFTVSPMKGTSKRFGQVMDSNRKKMQFQIPGSILVFEPNQYQSISIRLEDPGFLDFLQKLKEKITTDLGLQESIDIGILESEGYQDPLFRMKIADETSYYDVEKNRSTLEKVLVRGEEIHVAVQLNCTYEVENRVGVSWKALQIRQGRPVERISPATPLEKELDFID